MPIGTRRFFGFVIPAPETVTMRCVSGLERTTALATAAAVATEASGDIEDALGQYEQVATGWADYGHVLEHALALYGAGRSLAALSRPAEAAERLAAAREILVDLGATPTIAEIDGVADQAAAL